MSGSAENGSHVDVYLPVAYQVAVENKDVGVGYGDRLAVLAEVFHVDLRDDRVAGLVHLQDVVGETIDGGEEARHRLPHGGLAGNRVGVREAELRVRREVSDELVWVESVDVSEDRGYVPAHGALLHWGGRGGGWVRVSWRVLGWRGRSQAAACPTGAGGHPSRWPPSSRRSGRCRRTTRSTSPTDRGCSGRSSIRWCGGPGPSPPRGPWCASGRHRRRSRRWTGPRNWRGGSRGGCWR